MDIPYDAHSGHEAMVEAIRTSQPGAVFALLQSGVPSNNILGKNSYLAFAMFHFVKDPVEERAGIAHHLLECGARLDHFTDDDKRGPSALENADLWQHTLFGAAVMFAALSGALKSKQPLPRLRTGDMPYDGFSLADRQHTQLHLSNPRADVHAYGEHQILPKIRLALHGVEDVQDEVALRLGLPDSEAEVYVATHLPDKEKAFWRNPNLDPLGRALRLSGLPRPGKV
jgi:hypothetical protein